MPPNKKKPLGKSKLTPPKKGAGKSSLGQKGKPPAKKLGGGKSKSVGKGSSILGPGKKSAKSGLSLPSAGGKKAPTSKKSGLTLPSVGGKKSPVSKKSGLSLPSAKKEVGKGSSLLAPGSLKGKGGKSLPVGKSPSKPKGSSVMGPSPLKGRSLTPQEVALQEELMEEPQPAWYKLVKVFTLVFGGLFLVGLGYFISEKGTLPSSGKDLKEVMLTFNKLFKKKAKPVAVDDSDEGEDVGGEFGVGKDSFDPYKKFVKPGLAKLDEARRLYSMGKQKSDQRKILEAKDLLRESAELLKSAYGMEYDEEKKRDLGKHLQQIQVYISDCNKQLDFFGGNK